jgi:hypothetical protein
MKTFDSNVAPTRGARYHNGHLLGAVSVGLKEPCVLTG